MARGAVLDLERVEVLKGPQGTLFGQNSTGGAINYIAATPTDHLTGGLNFGYGRFNSMQGDAFISGPLTETLSARFAVTGTHSDDWQKNYLRDGELGAQRKVAARLLLDWRPNDDLLVSLKLNGWKDKSDNQAPQLVLAAPRVPAQAIPALFTLPLPPGNDRAADWDEDTSFERNNRFYQTVLRADWTVAPDVQVTSLSNFASVQVDSRYDADGTVFPLGDVTTSGHVDAFTQELRMSMKLARANYIFGANWQTDNVHENDAYSNVGQSAATNVGSPPLPPPGFGSILGVDNRGFQSNRSIGVFANAEWQLTDPLTLVAGARYTKIKHRNQACSGDTGLGDFAHVINGLLGAITGTPGSVLPGECITLDENFDNPFEKQSFSEDNVSWRAGLNYKPADTTLLYGLISRGYKAGNYPVINSTSRSQFTPVKQEQLTAYEVGIKSELPPWLQVNGAVYYYDYKDKQLLTQFEDAIFGLLPILANVPKSKAYGADLEIIATPVRGLRLRSTVGYAKTRIEDFTGYDVFGAPVDLDGKSFNFSPKWTALADAEYRFPVSAGLEAFVGADVTYNSSTYGDLAHSPELELPKYTLIGARLGVTADRWQAMLWGRNITDEHYATNTTIGIDTIYRLTGMPATYGVSFGYSF
jgi:outer membrane receptor protein involved in Fe transport